ncbi:MAG: aldo/keto reductase [Actinobacteria bacterium]|nr:aldo/keto reductase [Actinomycetota bacterium]
MEQRRVGDVEVGAVALGGANWSLLEIDPAEVEATIDAALAAGVTLIDTAFVYTKAGVECHNEQLIAAVLAGRGADAAPLVATKGGHYRDGDEFPIDGRPETIVRHCDASLAALGVDCIGLYQLHLPDPKVPFAESVGALAELKDAGKVRQVGLSNVTLAQFEEAREIVAIASVQNHLSPWAGQAVFHPGGPDGTSPEGDVLAACEAAGVAFLAYAPFTGPFGPDGESLPQAPRPGLEAIARERGVSRHQVIVAWLLAQSPAVIPIVGASRPASIRDAAAADDLRLTGDELARIAAPATAGAA